MDKHEYLDWQCKCGTTYALERNVPTVLHANHPERKKCQKKLDSNTKCGNPLPDQKLRNKLFAMQNIVIEEDA